MFLSGMCLGVAPRTDTKRPCFQKEIEWHAQNMLTILVSLVNMITLEQ